MLDWLYFDENAKFVDCVWLMIFSVKKSVDK